MITEKSLHILPKRMLPGSVIITIGGEIVADVASFLGYCYIYLLHKKLDKIYTRVTGKSCDICDKTGGVVNHTRALSYPAEKKIVSKAPMARFKRGFVLPYNSSRSTRSKPSTPPQNRSERHCIII